MPDIPPILSFTGDGVVLPCPIQPGALLQYYSVVWMKDSINNMIAEAISPQDVIKNDSRYSIDHSTFALIIDPVSVDDLNTDYMYQCQVYVTNPITGTKQQLQYYPQLTPGVRLSLSLSVKVNTDSKFYTIIELFHTYTFTLKFF